MVTDTKQGSLSKETQPEQDKHPSDKLKQAFLSGMIQVLDRITRPPRAVESYSTAAFPALRRTVQPEGRGKKQVS